MHKVTLAWQKYWGGWKIIFSGIESVKKTGNGGQKIFSGRRSVISKNESRWQQVRHRGRTHQRAPSAFAVNGKRNNACVANC